MEYQCEPCKYTTPHKHHFTRHLETDRHARNTVTKSFKLLTYSCANCDRLFQTRAGKWKHEKNCDGITVSPTNWKQGNADDESDVEQLKSILLSFIAQNKLDLSELHKQMNELHQTTSHQQNNFIGNNNVVNNYSVNVFLNTECKDAITLTEFVKNITIPMEVSKKAGELTYDRFIAKVFKENINRYSLTERPIHCADLKKEECHVKNEDGWSLDNGQGMSTIERALYKKQMINLSNYSKGDVINWSEKEKTELAKANKTSFGPEDEEEFSKIKKKAIKLCRESILLEL